MTVIRFTIPMRPRGKGRPRSTLRGGRMVTYTPRETRSAERTFVALAARHAPPRPLDGPLSVDLGFLIPYPKSWSNRRRATEFWHAGKPDLDNMIKLVLDAMGKTGRFWHDDAQVAVVMARKVRSFEPGVTVSLLQLWPPVEISLPPQDGGV